MRLVVTALLTAGLTLCLTATPARSSGAPDSELAELMYVLKRHLKGAATALQDPAQDAAVLEHVSGLQAAAVEAKRLSPPNLSSIPEDEREQHLHDFRLDLAKVLREFVEMEIDVLEGRRDQAMARVIDPLYPLREAAHEKYQAKD